MKHLKNLGLAAMAVAALNAMAGVSSAPAAEFHSAGGTTLTGEPTTNHIFEVTGQIVACNSTTFMGTAASSGTSTTQNLHPECHGGGTGFGLPAGILTAGCEYEFNANTNTMNLHGCTNGIDIDSSNIFGHCHVNIPNQNGINGQTFSNMGSTAGGTATLTWTTAATNIDENVNVSNGVCPLETGFHANSNYNGITGIMGATGGTHIN